MLPATPRFAPVIILTGILMISLSGCKKPDPPAPEAPRVLVMTVESKTIPVSETFIGQADSSKIVEIRPRVSGLIKERFFTEGTDVEEGQLLYQIDPEPFEANVRDAEAKVAQAQAREDLAQKNLARIKPLVESKAVAAKDLDDATAQLESAQADLRAAQATLDNAQIDLGYTRVIAPINGRIGKTLVNEGSNVSAQQTKLTDLQVINPIYINFTVPERTLLDYRKLVQVGKINEIPLNEFVVTAKFTDGSDFQGTGKINFQNTTLDTQTDSYPLRAEFANPQGMIIPGQFLQVTMTGSTRNDSILIPQKCVMQGAEGSSVYVVGQDSKAEIRMIKLLRQIGEDWLIEGGLKHGDQLIVEGIQRVRPGMPVQAAPYTRSAPASPSAVDGEDTPETSP